MTMYALAAGAGSFCFCTGMVWAGLSDLMTMKIKNRLILCLLCSYGLSVPAVGLSPVEIGTDIAVASAVLVCTMVLFAFRWIGGGDAKLAAVAALWLGSSQTLAFTLYTALLGGALTLVILQLRMWPLPVLFYRLPWLDRLTSRNVGIPYGVAIASAALLTFQDTVWIMAVN